MKRIMTIQDVSCVGKCSLTVALPIISAAGVEAGILPTAVLSTHTQFDKFTFCDLTDEIEKISDTLYELGIGFDAIYTGYLGSFRQLGLVGDFFDRFGAGALKVVDPVMADNGVLYKGFTPEFACAMARLCEKADLIIPNLTEASFMLGIPYNPNYDEEYIKTVLKRLTELGCPSAAISGVCLEDGKIGVYYYNAPSDRYFYYANERLPVQFHGTGDIFASATVGAIMRGRSETEALAVAVDFTLMCMKKTLADPDHRTYGVNFEEALPYYIELLK
ncbi:MAG: pyridoxamine kinase [Clostridia bacterium]|nr:pyridoxamine kinase [Clostridia bacterium]MBR3680938.1 pyridoxamine kinase [Clostridia bacterium]